ncbi:hypothetical protein [Shewanella sp. CG12_big_fil_rev_8_21_14_0_65_47_15]|uniref:hypothetical protein n=1 Tax=Shewanella sp. CG12_big_fil_rev_8_21_14_0_65_47_15 TaxID=1975537 RepID=UPI000CBED3EE|nr:hypothetical protein [Shewanella sp. CG12_big_fil_rev_8_21_14_0_65_47_15]PIW61308.1 MAG: hypothetical protein COW15_08730 [Shewanella sp. CG12_big_fil_rev_8_21_14_0_65_47_15]
MAMFLIAIIVLQFAGANLGTHQLHAGNSVEESENHPHLQFSAQVTALAQCLDCVCPNEQALGFADIDTGIDVRGNNAGENYAITGENQASEWHSHLVKTTEIQDFDLCLDCQCHGGHVALLTQVVSQPVPMVESLYMAHDLPYFSPDNPPKYRPPIA